MSSFWLLTHFWWGSVFLVNVPAVALALTAVWVLLPESRGVERPRLDLTGVVVSSLGLAGLTYGPSRRETRVGGTPVLWSR